MERTRHCEDSYPNHLWCFQASVSRELDMLSGQECFKDWPVLCEAKGSTDVRMFTRRGEDDGSGQVLTVQKVRTRVQIPRHDSQHSWDEMGGDLLSEHPWKLKEQAHLAFQWQTREPASNK